MVSHILYDQTDNIAPDHDSGAYEAVTITSSHFGTNALLNDALLRDDPEQGFSDVVYLNVGTLRYPGGTVTEKLFDLTDPEATSGHEDDGGKTKIIPITEFLNFAADAGSSVNIVIPTRPGLNLTAAEALQSGVYGDRIPTNVYLQDVANFVAEVVGKANALGVSIESFELGNEFWLGGRMTAKEYGRLAGEMALVVENTLSNLGFLRSDQPDILLQSVSNAGMFSPRETKEETFHENGKEYTLDIPGQGKAGAQLDALVKALEGVSGSVDAIDGIVDHYYDKQGFDGVDTSGQFIFEQFDELAAWLDERRDQQLPSLKRYVTEWNVKRAGGNEPQGLQGASVDVEMFYEMVTHGVDAAQFWPLIGGGNDLAGADDGVSINGEAFRLMSESLVGLNPELDYENSVIDVHGFGSSNRSVLLVSERSGSNQSNIELDFDHVYRGGKFFITITELSDGSSDGTDPTASPELTYIDGFISDDSIVTFDLEAWSIARIEITYMTAGADQIKGRDGNDAIVGGAGDDTLNGGSGHDTLHGQTGHDLIFGSVGSDVINGGQGHDTLQGGDGDDNLKGGSDNDVLAGNDGNDTLLGQEGNDMILAGLGADFVDGGLGNDTLTFESAEQAVTIWSGLGVVEVGSEITKFENIEVLIGSSFSDNMSIRSDQQELHGLSGDDRVTILNGRDSSVNLDAGNDVAFVYSGENNAIRGGDGNDEFFSFGGRDNVFEGGSGRDVFHFHSREPNMIHFTRGDGQDTVLGFNELVDQIIIQDPNLKDTMSLDFDAGNTVVSFGDGDSITLVGTSEFNFEAIVSFV